MYMHAIALACLCCMPAARQRILSSPHAACKQHHKRFWQLLLQPDAPLFATFDEALAATQPLKRAPPVPPGQSGNTFYTVQPQQMLSWYPRCTL